MKKVAIITARGGSKRIPEKNIKEFCGKPIIAYSIEAALNSKAFDEVMVSTDSEKIADVARKYGAAIPFMRSEETSNDFATTADVIEEVLKRYRKDGKEFDLFACIYPTAPFLTQDKLAKAIGMLEDSQADGVISVVRFSFPPQRAFLIRENRLQYQYPEYERARSQDLEPVYHDCGQFYICNCKRFMEKKSMVLPDMIPYVIPEEEVQDIDTLSDWKIAEAKYSVLNKT